MCHSNCTVAAEGSKQIEVAGLSDKRQLIAVFAASLAGDFLLPQIIYAGKTPRCLPTTKFPEDWNIMFTQNHWANEKTIETHIIKALVPHIETCRKTLSLPTNYAAIVIFDRLKGPCSSNILSLLDNRQWLLYHLAVQTVFSHLMLVSIRPWKNLRKLVSELVLFSSIQTHWWCSSATSWSQHLMIP